MDDDLTTGHTLAHVVIGFADQLQTHSFGAPRAKALSGAAGETQIDQPIRQASRSVAAGDLAGEPTADRPIVTSDRVASAYRQFLVERQLDVVYDFQIQRVVGLIVSRLLTPVRPVLTWIDVRQHLLEVELI